MLILLVLCLRLPGPYFLKRQIDTKGVTKEKRILCSINQNGRVTKPLPFFPARLGRKERRSSAIESQRKVVDKSSIRGNSPSLMH
jgi:hypothetical protein